MNSRAAAAVLLLLVGPSEVFGLLPSRDRDRSSWTRTMTQESSAPPELPVIWTELVGLRQLVLSLQAAVVDQRQSLRNSESRLRDGQELAEKQRQQLDAMQIQMNADRTLVLSLQAAAAADQRHALRTTETRLRNGEETVEKQRQVLDSLRLQVEADKATMTQITADLKMREERKQEDVSRLQSRLNASDSSVEDLKKKTSALAGDLPFLRTRLRASESALEQLKRKSSVLASRLCMVESLRKGDSAEEVRGQRNSSRGHAAASVPDRGVQRQEAEPRLDTDSILLRQNVSALHARVLHLEGEVMAGERHLRDFRAAVENTLNDTQAQSQGLEARLSAMENLVEGLQTDKSVISSQLSSMDGQLADGRNNTAELTVRLNVVENLQDQLKTNCKTLEVRLNVSENTVEELKTACTALEVRLNFSENNVKELNAVCTAQKSQLYNLESRLMHNIAALAVQLNGSEKLLEELKTESTAWMAQLYNVEAQLINIIHNTAALAVRLNGSEKLLEELKTESTAWTTQLHNMESRLTGTIRNTAALQVRLDVTEKLVEELKTDVTDRATRLSSLESGLTRNIHNTEVLMGKVNASEQRMTMSSAGEIKVAFAAALTDSGSVGPFDQETTLIFSKVFTNVGLAYDETSGVFTAPVGGVYVFSFTAADFLKGYMGVALYRNQELVVSSLDLNDHGGYASATNGALIPLEAGDRVRLSLPASYRLYDDMRSFSVFSGFLLFPLGPDQ